MVYDNIAMAGEIIGYAILSLALYLLISAYFRNWKTSFALFFAIIAIALIAFEEEKFKFALPIKITADLLLAVSFSLSVILNIKRIVEKIKTVKTRGIALGFLSIALIGAIGYWVLAGLNIAKLIS